MLAFLSVICNSLFEVPHTPIAAVSGGDVVAFGDIVGLAPNDIEAGALGVLSVAGRADIVKDASDVAAGAQLYWDATAKKATTTVGTNKALGKAVAAAGTATGTVNVLYGMSN